MGSALQAACSESFTEGTKLLLEHGADPNLQGKLNLCRRKQTLSDIPPQAANVARLY